jgi:hypothetical protein
MGASALLATVLLTQVGVSAADAEEPLPPPVITWTEPHALSLEYGVPWAFEATAEGTTYMAGSWTTTVDFHGGPAGYEPDSYSYMPETGRITTVSVYTPGTLPALKVGSYTIDVTVSTDGLGGSTGTTTTPASLTVTPAPLGIELRVLPDPNNSEAAIVSAAFTGRFVDEYQPSFYPSSAVSPGGEWHIALKDSTGEVAVERNVERAAGDDALATSFYWADAEPGEEYSATATFTPTGSSNANFSVSPATTFTFTAGESSRPVPSSTAAAEPASDLPEPTGFAAPLWLVILVSILIAGLGALVTVLSVRLRKPPSLASGEVSP